MELSGRASSLDLPNMLERLSVTAPSAPDGVFATSMFGTGVDVDRLGLMVVHGQPKTTASYIQATGRVGRASGGLVVTFFRASRPRDLDHYEFFTGYHHALYRHVEPVTVSPFSPRARERALGPLSVILLRHASEIGGRAVDPNWRVQQRISGGYHSEAGRMSAHRHDSEVEAIPNVMENRALRQPRGRRPVQGTTASETRSELDRWAALAGLHRGPNHFVYDESTANSPPRDTLCLETHSIGCKDSLRPTRILRSHSGKWKKLPDFRPEDDSANTPFAVHNNVRSRSILEGRDGPRLIPTLGDSQVFDGRRPTDFEITDQRLSQALLNSSGILRLPSNAEVNEPDLRYIYQTYPFPSWSLCVQHGVLYRKTSSDSRACPQCPILTGPRDAWRRARRDSIRFVRACVSGTS